MHTRSLLVAGVALASLLLGACGGADEPAVTPAAGSPTSQTPVEDPDGLKESSGKSADAPYTDKYNFTATTFDGETFELAVHKGTPVVINFWESW